MGSQESYSQGEDGFEALYGPEGHYVGLRVVWTGGQSFGAAGDYIDISEFKCSGHFPEEGGFLVIGFDHGQMDVGGPDLQGKSGESGPGTDVEDANTSAQAELGRGTLQSWGLRVRGARREEVASHE